MLAPVFQKLLWMSFSAAWLSLAVFALRPLLRKTPRWVVLLLWALVAVRLVCPLSIESRVSLMPRPETVASALQAPEAESAPQPLPMDAMSRVWLAGMGAMLLWGLWGDLRLRRRVRVSMPQGENVRVCDEIQTPFVLGLLRPSIYLPSSLDAAQAGYVLAHERAHIARGDHWWKPLGWVLLSVYWFQPLLWLSYVLFCRDLELACDERVARSLDRAGLAAYSEALLRCSTRRGTLASPIAFGEVGVKARVRAILRYRRPLLRRVVPAVLAVLVMGVTFLTDRPAMALLLPEALQPVPDREAEWTIRLDEHHERADALPDDSPAPEGTTDGSGSSDSVPAASAQGGTSVPASQSFNSVSQGGVDQAALDASLQQHLNEMNEQAAEANRQAAARNIANGSAPSLNSYSSSNSNTLGITPDYYSNDPPPGPTSALTVSTGSAPANPSVPNPNPQTGVVQYNDGTVAISLFP